MNHWKTPHPLKNSYLFFLNKTRFSVSGILLYRETDGQTDRQTSCYFIIMMIIILGIKEWIFVAPGEENKVEISPANYIYDIESLESLKLQV